MSKQTLIKNGTLVTMDPKRRVLRGDLLIKGNRIEKIAKSINPKTLGRVKVIDATDTFVIPGMVQVHTHLVQCLFRGYADDLPLLDWLEKKIWPMEFHHSKNSVQSSAEVALLEMQSLGTTSILDMGTVKHTDALLQTVAKSGMRYWGGKCLMDLKKTSGPLYEDTDTSLRETESLIKKWHGYNELIQYVLCPRFVVSCSERLLQACHSIQQQQGIKVHIHASESKDEIALVKKRTGKNNIDYLGQLGLLNPDTVVVHGVHMSNGELAKMVKSKTPLAHCPSANLKLASGIAPIHKYRQAGLTVGIGSDGAPCNNTMDPFFEMRLAALLQKPTHGPEALPAQSAFEMATIDGAKVLGAEQSIGSLEVGKLADVVTVKRTHPSVHGVDSPYSALVYSCSGRDVNDVFINGSCIVKNGKHQVYNSASVLELASRRRRQVLNKIG